ncbi:MAG: FAD-dependent oxidoreductase [Clostridia bacterium]|nr:FAD-dependent oxidoreductase [Clostridia bacterium]
MYDTIIIGSGSAGLSAAVYAKRAVLDFIVIEKEYLGTGQIAESGRVDNYLGLYGENGFDLGEKFREHAAALGTEFLEGEVISIAKDGNAYKIVLSDNSELLTKSIIFATGAAPRKLDIQGESEFSGRGVSYCAVCDGAFYKDKITAVVGGGDTALEDALLLSRTCKKVYLVHRRDEFRANKSLQNLVKNTENIELVLNAKPCEIIGDKKVNALKILQNGEERTLELDGVFAAVGTVPNSKLLNGIAELDSHGYVVADETGVTSAQGIFAAGDVRTKQLRQVSTAVADGANSVCSLERFLGCLKG